MRVFFVTIMILSLATGISDAQVFNKVSSRKADKGFFGKSSRNSKEIKIKEPGKVVKAKKKQEANERKIKKDYAKSIKRSQRRTFDIQTPEVQARMKQNQKDLVARNKTKRKKTKTGTRKAGKKYK